MSHGRVKTWQRIGRPPDAVEWAVACLPSMQQARAPPGRACVGRGVVNRRPGRAGYDRRRGLDRRARRSCNRRRGFDRRAWRRRDRRGGFDRSAWWRRSGRSGCDRCWACRYRRRDRRSAVGTELGAVGDTLAALCAKHGKPPRETLEMWAGAIVRRSSHRFNGTRGTTRAAAPRRRRNARPTLPRCADPRSISPFVLRAQGSRP